MTSRERMLTAMRNGQPDRVPVAPDMSNMIPCRLTGKPFWDIYLYRDPPLWQAYIDAVEYFGTDGWIYSLDGFNADDKDEPAAPATDDGVVRQNVIVARSKERIVTREFTRTRDKGQAWSQFVNVYPRSDPPTYLLASKVGLEQPPRRWWPIEGVKRQKQGFALMRQALDRFAGRGVIGAFAGPPQLVGPDQGFGYSIYDYQDRREEVLRWSRQHGKWALAYLKRMLAGPVRPDFILTGGSGMLVNMTPALIREIALPWLAAITRVCKQAGIPSQIHCCGPERELVAMCAAGTDLDSINPLEVPPMGNCHLAEIKRSFGRKLGLMGNLHTTEVMLRGSVKCVRLAALEAIRDAGEGGGFILSTGDQCGRDTPEANIRELVAVAGEFGHYPLNRSAIEREIRRLAP